MSYVIDINKLERGDVILRRWPGNKMSEFIMGKTESNYSHAMLCVDYSSVIEAGDIVGAINPIRDSFDNVEDTLVLRLKEQYRNADTIDKAIIYVRRLIGTEYSIDEAKGIIKAESEAKEPNRQICSRLISKAFESAGLRIVDNIDYPSIKDLEESVFFEKVKDCHMEVTPQIQEILDSECVIPEQTRVITDLLNKCRNLYPNEDIQTFEQLFKTSLKFPDKNNQLAELIRQSGYLDLWKKEEELNPHDYNPDLFIAKHTSNVGVAAIQSLEANNQCKQRFELELKAFELNDNCDNPVIDIFISLYKNLVRQCLRRESTLKEVFNMLSQDKS